jgi:hypothetical protein
MLIIGQDIPLSSLQIYRLESPLGNQREIWHFIEASVEDR